MLIGLYLQLCYFCFYYRVYIYYVQRYTHFHLFLTAQFYPILTVHKLMFCNHIGNQLGYPALPGMTKGET